MSATPPTDWDNESLTANATSSTVVPSESGCDDWRDSDSDQLPDWYETHIAALSARDGLNSANELTPSLVLWGSRWNLLQMLQFGALRKSVLAAPCRDVRAIASRALIRSGESEAGSA